MTKDKITIPDHEVTADPVYMFQVKQDGAWETLAVFATRDEARAHGERRPYAWGAEFEGWRTYSVPCHGALKEILTTHWVLED